MQFSDTSTKTGIVQEIDALCDTDSTSYPLASKTRRVNNAYEEIVGRLIARNGEWQFDDTNYSSFPIGVATLVAGQQDYTLDTAHLVIERVQVLDAGGIWRLLTPIDRKNIGVPMEEYQKTNGLPQEYDKQGNSILLYPAPASGSVTTTNGLRVYFQRTASLFAASDTTKTPGFASPYHILLALKAAIPYCAIYKKDRVPYLLGEVQRLERGLFDFETNKDKDVEKAFNPSPVDSR